MITKKCVAMLLAGGQGSRLEVLTKNTAKPAVPFGGKYRIIDFALSNCANSGIDTIGVLTQYKPLKLNSYIGKGRPWDLDRLNGGVTILPPYMTQTNGEWYSGTANAIYQNMEYIEAYHPEYVLIISGDQIYKMDYRELLRFHETKKADVTIASHEVPWEEASRFGIINTDESSRIIDFTEKPKKPASNKASMGIYIFTWKKLRQYLIEDQNTPGSTNDFGRDLIPKMHKRGERMFAFPFKGYWKDVGTLQSYWEANMDLLEEANGLNLQDRGWRIYSRNSVEPPHFIAPTANVKRCIIAEGGSIFGEAYHSILFSGVTIGKGSRIHNSILMPNVKVGENAIIEDTIIAENTIISDNCRIGCRIRKEEEHKDEKMRFDKTVIGENLVLPPGYMIDQGAIVDADNYRVWQAVV